MAGAGRGPRGAGRRLRRAAPRAPRRRGVKHPVHDFLFTYYSQRPAQLRRWHPGSGVALAGDAAAYAGLQGVRRRPTARVARDPRRTSPSQRPLSSRCAGCSPRPRPAPPHLGCFGLHEWAMVYRPTRTRSGTPTGRCGSAPSGTDAVVEAHRIGCTHFDAFRFFTDAGPAAEHAAAHPRRPGRPRAAGLPARRDGPLQVGLPADPAGAAASWSPTASSWPATSASSTCAPRRTTFASSATSRSASRPPPGKPEYAAAQRALRRARRPAARPARRRVRAPAVRRRRVRPLLASAHGD